VDSSIQIPPLVTVTHVQVETVHLKKRKMVTELLITFSGALNAAAADILANYHLATPGKGKKSKTYNKFIYLKSAVYDRTAHQVTLLLTGKLALTRPPQLRITASGILDASGRPLDGNHDVHPGGDYVALLTNRGAQPQIVRGAVAFARRPPGFPTRP